MASKKKESNKTLAMQSSRSLGASPSTLSVQESGNFRLSHEFALLDGARAAVAISTGRRALRGPCLTRSPQREEGSPPKRLRAPEERNSAASATASSDGVRESDEDRWRMLQQLSQVIPTARSLLPGEADLPPDDGALEASMRAPGSASSDTLDWELCNRALDRLVGGSSKPKESLGLNLGVASCARNGEMGLFDLPVGEARSNNGIGIVGDDMPNDFFEARTNSPLAALAVSSQNSCLMPVKCDTISSSKAANPMKERQRRELQQKKTLDLASQIVSRFRGARRPGVLQLLHRFFSCSTRQVRDPQELEKLVGACCYIIARQQGDDMSLNDVTAQLEKRQGTKGRQRCRCISKWVVRVCGKLQLRCLPRHRDAEAMASNALRRICSHLKLLLTQQEQQELLLLHHLKEAYRQCLQQETAACPSGSNSSNNNQQEQQGKDTGLADLDDEELLRLLLLQQQEESAAAVGSAVSDGREKGNTASTGAIPAATTSADGLPDVDDFLKQFDADCEAEKPQIEDEGWESQAAAKKALDDSLVSLGADGSLQLGACGRGGKRGLIGRETDALMSLEGPSLSGEEEPIDPVALDEQIQQHECVLRLLRLLPSAQRIKLDHSIWLQKQRKLALQQLCEQSSLVIKCVGLLQQLTAITFASAAAKKGYQPGAMLQPPVAAETRRDGETSDRQGVCAEEDPLNDKWRACGRCDAISTAAHFVIVLECLQVPVFQRVVLEALEVDRRSVYKRRREQLHLALSIFRRLPGAENVTIKTLSPHLIRAVNDPKVSSELLQIAETETFPSIADGFGGGFSDEKQSNTTGPTSSHLTSQTVSHNSREESTIKGVESMRGSIPVGCHADTASSAAAAAAALRELEEGDPVLAETPMARVVSLQYERTQQRWVCKWREGVGTGGRWHRRCFSVVKYGEDGAHTLAAAVAKKLRDKRNQEARGTKPSAIPSSEGTPGGGGNDSASNAGSKRPVRASPPPDGHPIDRVYSRPVGASAKARNKRSGAAGGGCATASSQDAGSSYSFLDGSESQSDPLLATLPADSALSSVVASATYSDEMDRLAQLLHKARSNPLLAKWLDERAPPPGAAALRAAAESLVPYLALQTATVNKTSPGGAAPFGAQQEPTHRRGRVAGAREGM